MRIIFIAFVLLVSGYAFAQTTEEVTPIDENNISLKTTYTRIMKKEDLINNRKLYEAEIIRVQEAIRRIDALLAQYEQ